MEGRPLVLSAKKTSGFLPVRALFRWRMTHVKSSRAAAALDCRRYVENFWQGSSFRLSIAMSRRISHALVGAIFVLLGGCATVTKDTSRTFKTVVVDPGHGGKDSGAVRRYGPAEKFVTLDVAQRLNRKLHESQLRTVMTRDSDVFIPLDQRVAIGNAQRNSIFVSIHFNDSRKRAVQGFETYYRSPVSFDLARRIQSQICSMPGAVNRGVHVANFRVIRKATYPSVLVECGFLSNRSEGREAGSAEYRERLADKIAEAIVEHRYGSGVYRAPPTTAAAEPPPTTGQTPAPQAAPPGFFINDRPR
jgi:N-acetylmuramoyl-L-alanine amidase